MKHRFTTLFIILCAFGGDTHGHGKAPAVAAGERSIDFPDVAGYVTLVADLHTHSVFSDGHVWPKIRVEEALRDGLDALAITEHLEYQPHRADLPHSDRNRAYEEARDAALDTELMVIAGSEITREQPAGHINAVFLSDANALFHPLQNAPEDAVEYYREAQQWPAQNALDAAHAQNAFVFINHPHWQVQKPNGIAELSRFQKQAIKSGKLHGVEIANGQDYSEEAFALALRHHLTLVGTSDVHDLVDWDYQPLQGGHRPVTLIFSKERSAAAMQEALLARRTAVWFRNVLIGRPAEIEALLAASLTAEKAAYMPGTEIVEFTLFNRSDAAFELRNLSRYTFMESGDRIRVPPHGESTLKVKPGKKLSSITLEFEVENTLVAPKKSATVSFTLAPNSPETR